METVSLVTNLDVETSNLLPKYAREAERELSALFLSVRDSFGEKTAFCVADGWLEIFGTCLADCGSDLPKVRDITVQSITCFLAPSTAQGHQGVTAFPSDAPEH